MRTIVTYTLARIGLFLVAFGLVWLAGYSWLQWNAIGILWSVLIALMISAVASFVLLRGMRDRFAQQLKSRSTRMNERIQRARGAEDVD